MTVPTSDVPPSACWKRSMRLVPRAVGLAVGPPLFLALIGFWWVLVLALVLPAMAVVLTYIALITAVHVLGGPVLAPLLWRAGPERCALLLSAPCLLLACPAALSGPLLTAAGHGFRAAWHEEPAVAGGLLVDLAAENWLWLALAVAGPLLALIPSVVLPALADRHHRSSRRTDAARAD